MHVRTLISLCVSLFAWTVATSAASAQEVEQASLADEVDRTPRASATAKEKDFFVGLSAGATYAMVKHPLINSDGFAAVALGLHAGMNVTENWAIGVELLAFSHGMSRPESTASFTPTSFLSPQAGCDKCADRPPPVGGWIKATDATFSTIGPRIEFAPFGRDGLYLGLTTGLAMGLGVDTQYGFGGGGRLGYRYRWAHVIGLAVEGGVQAQHFSTGTNVFPYMNVVLRPYF